MAALTEEQTLIRDQAEAWVRDEFPVTKFRAMRDSKADGAIMGDAWQGMVEMGWTGILVPEAHGGSDLGYLTFGLVLEALGKNLTASPLLASALVGASALRLAGSDAQQAAVLPGVVDGSIILSLAVDEGARHNPAQTACTATAQGDGFVLKGEKRFVLEGMSATHFIVPARTAGAPGEEAGLTLFLVAADATGLSRTGLSLVDSRGYADLTLDNVAVGADAVLGEVDGAFPVLDAILDRARAGLSAEMMGTAGQAFAMLVDFLKTREQFGRVIGSFQALGHRAAQMFTDQQLARSCAEAALASIDNDAPASTVAEMASLAKARVGDHLHLVSRELIQMHGGIGMTDEYDAGFYPKRARALEATYGSQAFHRERYASLLGY